MAWREWDQGYRQASARRRALRLAALPGVVVLVVGFLATWAAVGPAPAAGVALVGGAAAGVGAWVGAPGVIRHLVGARATTPGDHPRLHNLTEGLCVATGLVKPRILVVPHDSANSMVVGTSSRRAALVATTGLVDRLTPIELEAVIAHELSHLKSGDAVPATVAVTALGPVAMVAGGTKLLARATGGDREPLADLAAVSLTRYPPGLAAALAKVVAAPLGPATTGLRARLTAHLWLCSSREELGERTEVLQEL